MMASVRGLPSIEVIEAVAWALGRVVLAAVASPSGARRRFGFFTFVEFPPPARRKA